jgi:hypothetical protein
VTMAKAINQVENYKKKLKKKKKKSRMLKIQSAAHHTHARKKHTNTAGVPGLRSSLDCQGLFDLDDEHPVLLGQDGAVVELEVVDP